MLLHGLPHLLNSNRHDPDIQNTPIFSSVPVTCVPPSIAASGDWPLDHCTRYVVFARSDVSARLHSRSAVFIFDI